MLIGHPRLSPLCGVGPKPIPGDGDPVLGRSTTYPACRGFTHSGATLGLIAGELLAYEIIDRPLPSHAGRLQCPPVRLTSGDGLSVGKHCIDIRQVLETA